MDKDKKKKYYEIEAQLISMIWFLFLSLSVAACVYGTLLIGIGFHNFDIAHNLKYINSETKNNFVDFVDADTYLENNDQLALGVDQMQRGLVFLVAGAFVVGVCSIIFFGAVMSLIENEHKN